MAPFSHYLRPFSKTTLAQKRANISPFFSPSHYMITRHRSSALTIQNSKMLLIELEDPTTKVRFWSVPGGGIEKGESAVSAAIRETLEETGYQVNVIKESKLETRYSFHWDAKDYDCHTTWFLAIRAETKPVPVNDEAYLLRHAWHPTSDKEKLFKNHPEILDAVTRLLTADG